MICTFCHYTYICLKFWTHCLICYSIASSIPPTSLTPNHISCSHCFKCPRCSSALSVQQYLMCPEDEGGTETTPEADKGRTLKNVVLACVWIEMAKSAVEYEQTCSLHVQLLFCERPGGLFEVDSVDSLGDQTPPVRQPFACNCDVTPIRLCVMLLINGRWTSGVWFTRL